MLIIEMAVGGAAALFGHVKSKDFVRRRLRYTSVVEKPSVGMGVAAGAVTAAGVAALPFVGMLPIGLLVGAGVGTGVAAGIKHARKGGPSDGS